jgi:hypothetical protein
LTAPQPIDPELKAVLSSEIALSRPSGTSFALKVDDHTAAQSIEQELAILKTLNHPLATKPEVRGLLQGLSLPCFMSTPIGNHSFQSQPWKRASR